MVIKGFLELEHFAAYWTRIMVYLPPIHPLSISFAKATLIMIGHSSLVKIIIAQWTSYSGIFVSYFFNVSKNISNIICLEVTTGALEVVPTVPRLHMPPVLVALLTLWETLVTIITFIRSFVGCVQSPDCFTALSLGSLCLVNPNKARGGTDTYT